MMQRTIIGFFLCGFCALVAMSFVNPKPNPLQKQVLRRIVIDPGHGGTDGGARGKFSNEKDIALAVSLKLEQMLRDEMPDVEVVMTRQTDIFHSVITKAQIANQAKGDLFVCIHVNDATPIRHREVVGHHTETYYKGKGKKKKKYTRKVTDYNTWTTPNPAKGTETYIYGVGKTDAKKEALTENMDMYMDSVSAKILNENNSNDPTKMMISTLKTQQYFQRSANLALTIEEEFQKLGRVSRQAQQRQKGIWVLQAVAMPAVLIETGFISNPEEEEYLNSDNGQREICEVIIRSLKRYKYSLEKQLSVGGSK
jgi:N-acetylmuramoyl-L-alanine amidase